MDVPKQRNATNSTVDPFRMQEAGFFLPQCPDNGLPHTYAEGRTAVDDMIINYEKIARCIRLFNERWNIEIILTLYSEGTLRFSDINKYCISLFSGNINSSILTHRLKILQKRSLIERKECKETPRRVEYKLTYEGKQLAHIFCNMIFNTLKIINKTDKEKKFSSSLIQYFYKNRDNILRIIRKEPKLLKHMGKIIEKLGLYNK